MLAPVLRKPARQAGVTLIELMVCAVILLISLAWAVPAFTLWLQSTQIRTAAESIRNGMQLARAEAVRRNAVVSFKLSDANGTVAWSVSCVTVSPTCPGEIQARPAADGTPNARAGVSNDALPSPVPANHFSTALAAGAGMPAEVQFDSLGRVEPASEITRIDVTSAAESGARRMVITLSAGGQIRMCDPAFSLATNASGCS